MAFYASIPYASAFSFLVFWGVSKDVLSFWRVPTYAYSKMFWG